jgi:hypothetical protein
MWEFALNVELSRAARRIPAVSIAGKKRQSQHQLSTASIDGNGDDLQR